MMELAHPDAHQEDLVTDSNNPWQRPSTQGQSGGDWSGSSDAHPQPGQYQTPATGYQQSPYQTQNPYQQTGYNGQSGYQPATSYGTGPTQPYGSYYGAEGPKSPTLGYVGLGLVVIATIACCVTAYVGGTNLNDVMQIVKSTTVDSQNLPPEADAPMGRAGLMLMLGIGASVVGLAGWICSIIATSQKRGRPAGITGIVVGIIAPVLAFIIFVAMLMPSINQYGN